MCVYVYESSVICFDFEVSRLRTFLIIQPFQEIDCLRSFVYVDMFQLVELLSISSPICNLIH